MSASFPDHFGFTFTKVTHSELTESTHPTNNRLPAGFNVLITGAGKGVGKGIALSYAKAGASGLVITSRTQSDLENLASEIKQIKPDCEVLIQTCDTTSDSDVDALAKITKSTFDRLDVAVANAGIISSQITKNGKQYLPSGIVEDPDFSRVIDTNLLGSWRVAKGFVPLLNSGPRALVVITSAASHMKDSTITPISYVLSKVAINRMVECIRNDHEGVQAFAVHPGSVLTPQTERHNQTQLGSVWDDLLNDDPALCGGFVTWLTREKREWLSGRYLSANWDVEELEKRKDEIVEKDLLTFRMAV